MDKRERAARNLERKIERAIQSGAFVPDYGYLSNTLFVHGKAIRVPACGCAVAAAAVALAGTDPKEGCEWDDLEAVGLSSADAHQLERGYEGWDDSWQPADRSNPYWQAGNRLSRFHPVRDGQAGPREVVS